jgi:hypothetical protein
MTAAADGKDEVDILAVGDRPKSLTLSKSAVGRSAAFSPSWASEITSLIAQIAKTEEVIESSDLEELRETSHPLGTDRQGGRGAGMTEASRL